MKISIIVPSYNEGKTLPIIVSKLLALNVGMDKEIIVIDDGSNDNTVKITQKLKSSSIVKVITNDKNLGKGASIQKALAIASGDIFITQDADLEYNPNDIKKLLKPFKNKKVKVVYGSRILQKNPVAHWTYYLGARLITVLTNTLYGLHITDEPTGYKAFRKGIFKHIKIKSRGFEFCPEITAKVAKLGINIVEVPINYKPRKPSEKKIKWHDGLWAIFYLIKYRFVD